jgi:hypothetical protein
LQSILLSPQPRYRVIDAFCEISIDIAAKKKESRRIIMQNVLLLPFLLRYATSTFARGRMDMQVTVQPSRAATHSYRHQMREYHAWTIELFLIRLRVVRVMLMLTSGGF